ncbi:MAG: Uma2 family endonuclease [Bacteroidota bacterium]
MTATINKTDQSYLLLETLMRIGKEITVEGVSKEDFLSLCTTYPDLIFEREANGMLIVLMPLFGGSAYREGKLIARINIWCENHGEGMAFGAGGGFDLPSGATKSPDVAWISDERLAKTSLKEIENSFVPVVPDFIIELRSKTDKLEKVKRKMQHTWMASGVRLGWLIDPYEEKAYIYREDGSIEIVKDFDGSLSGEEVLPEFELKLKEFRVLG